MTGRVYLLVEGCESTALIAFEDPSHDQQLMVEAIAAAIAQGADGQCLAAAVLDDNPLTVDPIVIDCAPVRSHDHRLGSVCVDCDEPAGVPEPCRDERCRLDEGHDGNHQYYAHASDDPWAPHTGDR